MTLHFDAIDVKAGKARLIGNQGASDVQAASAYSAISLFETTLNGNVNYTTVFATYRPGTDQFLAVSSRHLATLPDSPPMTSQYYGTCRVWE